MAGKAGPRCNHILVAAVLYDLQVSYSIGFTDLVSFFLPALASIGAAPDCSFGTCYSEVGTAEEDQIRIVDAEAHVVKVGLIQGPLIRAERSPCPVYFRR